VKRSIIAFARERVARKRRTVRYRKRFKVRATRWRPSFAFRNAFANAWLRWAREVKKDA
jgi:hypothetical protein